jgi:hypothetical protein
LPLDRPLFSVSGGIENVLVAGGLKQIDLQALPINEGVISQMAPGFLLRLVDDDGDGMPDDANGDGRPDLWPRVVVRKVLTDRPLIDENDLDKNGIVDADGEDYELAATGQKDGKPDVVVLAALFDPTEYLSQLIDANGRVKQTPTPVAHLKLTLVPQAFDASNPAAPQKLLTPPAGTYAITVIQQTGQTWRVPNELSTGDAFGLPVVPSQRFVVQVQ